MKSLLPILLVVILCSTGAVVLRNVFTGNQKAEKSQEPQGIVRDMKLKGFQLSPSSYIGTSLPDFFTLNKTLGGTAVGWTGAPQDLSRSNGAPKMVINAGKQYGFTPIITIQTYDRETGTMRSDFINGKEAILAFIDQYKPLYFGMGVEVNLLYEKNPDEYGKFVNRFNEYAGAIHKASPQTKVFATFQLEHVKGLNGGLFGGKNEPSNRDWQLVEQLTSADIVGITSYPTLIYTSPATVPATYYSDIYKRTSKPVLFTELGWLRTKAIKGWEGSEDEQEKFLETLNSQINTERTVGILWSFLYDQQAAKLPFSEMGLRSRDKAVDATLSPAEKFWKTL